MFYELYADQNVTYGGVWFDPEDNSAIEVIDMESATGDKGVFFIERGSLHVTEENLKRAVESAGRFHEESPPHKAPEGRKRWISVPFVPSPKPGYLFWVPEPILGPKILEAWGAWTIHQEQGGEFEELPEEIRDLVLMGASDIESYSGIGEGEIRVVIQNYPGAKKKKEKTYPNAIISNDPEKSIWKILKEMGVRRDA